MTKILNSAPDNVKFPTRQYSQKSLIKDKNLLSVQLHSFDFDNLQLTNYFSETGLAAEVC